MGYYSDFQIIINTSCEEKADEVLAKLAQYAKGINDCNQLMKAMLASALSPSQDSVVLLENSSWKLYAWDSMVADLVTMFDTDEEVDIAWAIIGEDINDINVRHGTYTYPNITRLIDDPNLLDIPIKQQTRQIQVSAPAEETCGHCGKNKDRDKNCWWCGN